MSKLVEKTSAINDDYNSDFSDDDNNTCVECGFQGECIKSKLYQDDDTTYICFECEMNQDNGGDNDGDDDNDDDGGDVSSGGDGDVKNKKPRRKWNLDIFIPEFETFYNNLQGNV